MPGHRTSCGACAAGIVTRFFSPRHMPRVAASRMLCKSPWRTTNTSCGPELALLAGRLRVQARGVPYMYLFRVSNHVGVHRAAHSVRLVEGLALAARPGGVVQEDQAPRLHPPRARRGPLQNERGDLGLLRGRAWQGAQRREQQRALERRHHRPLEAPRPARRRKHRAPRARARRPELARPDANVARPQRLRHVWAHTACGSLEVMPSSRCLRARGSEGPPIWRRGGERQTAACTAALDPAARARVQEGRGAALRRALFPARARGGQVPRRRPPAHRPTTCAPAERGRTAGPGLAWPRADTESKAPRGHSAWTRLAWRTWQDAARLGRSQPARPHRAGAVLGRRRARGRQAAAGLEKLLRTRGPSPRAGVGLLPAASRQSSRSAVAGAPQSQALNRAREEEHLIAFRSDRCVVYCRTGELVVYICGSDEDQDVVLSEVLGSVVLQLKVRQRPTSAAEGQRRPALGPRSRAAALRVG
eukprot:scaffold4409_cov369-Prasinococcus_capsulatus_cf.AAC.10